MNRTINRGIFGCLILAILFQIKLPNPLAPREISGTFEIGTSEVDTVKRLGKAPITHIFVVLNQTNTNSGCIMGMMTVHLDFTRLNG